MKKIITVILTLTVLSGLLFAPIITEELPINMKAHSSSISANGFSNELNISAEKAILIEKESGIILYSKNADEKSGMASTTKIMTAIIVIENFDIEKEITIPKEAVGVEGSSLYLKEGEIFTVIDLLYGLLLESGNDVAVALAIGLCGNIDNFTTLMNEKAEELKMINTHFSNPHGLSDSNHFSSARDMGILSVYAMNNEIFRNIVSTKKYMIKPKNSEYIRYCSNHNKLLWADDNFSGIKTGFTKSDGRCLISSFKNGDLELICVTLNAPDHWNDHKLLFKDSIEKFEKRILADENEYASEIQVVGGNKSYITCSNLNKISVTLPKNIDIEFKIITPPFVYAPIKKGDYIGEVRIYSDEIFIYSFPLQATENVEQKKISFFKKIFG